MDDSTTSSDLELPGFRFHPTEEELLDFYLKSTVLGKKLHCDIIGRLNIYDHDPWDLPGLAKIGEREWYFFVPRDRKHGSGGGGRPNRTTKRGFWKATGSDRKILSLSNPKKMIGLKKTLVFYTGRAPRGCKTDWVMNEYRLPDYHDRDHRTCHSLSGTPNQAVVLCKIYRKATSLRVLEQRAGVDQQQPEEAKALSIPVLLHHHHHTSSTDYYYYASGRDPSSSPPLIDDAASICNNIQQHDLPMPYHHHPLAFKKEDEELSSGLDKKHVAITPASPASTADDDEEDDDDDHDSLECKGKSRTCTNNLRLPSTTTTGKSGNKLAELQVPSRLSMDWMQDPFWAQLRSPWLDNLATPNYHANVLNF